MNESEKTTVTFLVHQLHAEHGKLHQSLAEIRNQFDACQKEAGPVKAKCLADLIQRMQTHIEAHFAHEERGGWLEEAVVRAPHLSHRLTLLEKQHTTLRSQIAKLVEMAKTHDGSVQCSTRLRDHFERFAKQLLEHEAEEERVLAEGFNEELE